MHKKWTLRVELTKKIATVRVGIFFENADQQEGGKYFRLVGVGEFGESLVQFCRQTIGTKEH